jgi:hypothetical protein
LKTFCSKYIDKVEPIVIEFATVLFEMSVGYELEIPNIDYLPPGIPNKVKKVLQSIFSTNPELRTLADFASVNFIAETKLFSDW